MSLPRWRGVQGRATALVVLGAICGGGCVTHTVRQSTLVPAAVLPPMGHRDGPVNFQLSDATVTFLSRPKRAPNSNAGLWITRHLFQAGVSTSVGEHVAIRLSGLYGLSEGAMAAAPTTLRNPGRNTFGYGSGVDVRFNTAPHHLNVTLDVRILSTPSHFEATCIASSCEGMEDVVGDRSDGVFQASAAVTYGVDLDRDLRGLFTVALQNHPTNREEFASASPTSEVDAGPLNAIVGLGLDVSVSEWFGLVPTLQWPITRDPVVYGPIVGIALRGAVLEQPSR